MLKLVTKLTARHVNNYGKEAFSGSTCTPIIGFLPSNQFTSIHRRYLISSPREKVPEEDVIPRTNVKTAEDAQESIRLQKIKHAMQQHLKKVQEEVSLRTEKKHEFEIGRRHLANMMGADPETFAQDDINKAIEYLMPSGLFEPRARPVMKPPEELNPVKQGNEVDQTGRPVNMFFYTGRGALNSILHNITSQLLELNRYEDKMIRKGFAKPPPETQISLGESEWITLGALKTMLMDDKLPQDEYDYLIESLERLVEHPYSFKAKDLITKYRKLKTGFQKDVVIQPLTVGEDGIPYAQAEGRRKWTRAQVIVRGKGTGKVDINGMEIDYFSLKQDREQLLFPLKFSGLLNQVDIEARVTGSTGHSAEAGAIRHGLSQALCSFVSPQLVEQLRIAGLTGQDVRMRERKKPGQKGARAKFKWRKR